MTHRKGSDLVDRRGLQYELGDLVIFDTRWEVLLCPHNELKGAAPTVENTGALRFAPNKVRRIYGVIHLPHGWHEETPLKPHVHWQKTTSEPGDVLWELDYEIVTNGEVAALDYALQFEQEKTDPYAPDSDTMNKLLITYFGDMDTTGYHVSDMIFWRLRRKGTDVRDTYPGDARLCEFNMYYQNNALGSQSVLTDKDHLKMDEEKE